MHVFLPRLNDLTTRTDLLNVCSSVLASKFHLAFTESPKLLTCEVLEIKDSTGCRDHHGLLCIQPESAANWFIKHIKKKRLHGKRLLGRQYFHREQDRRLRDTEAVEDRRRPNISISRVKGDKPTCITEGIDRFHVNHDGH
jgi:hypothetical protein